MPKFRITFMLSVAYEPVMLSVVMLSVVKLSAVMLNVVAPSQCYPTFSQKIIEQRRNKLECLALESIFYPCLILENETASLQIELGIIK